MLHPTGVIPMPEPPPDLTANQVVCTNDADCDDGSFCNGQEFCDVATGLCLPGAGNPCRTFEDYSVPCDDDLDSCAEPDPGSTWIAGAVRAGGSAERVSGPERGPPAPRGGVGVRGAVGPTVDGLGHATRRRDPSGGVGARLGVAGGEGELRAHRPEGLGDAAPQCSRGARNDSALPIAGESIEGVWYRIVRWARFCGHSGFILPSKKSCTV